jgi:hypothetical protein
VQANRPIERSIANEERREKENRGVFAKSTPFKQRL